MAETAAALALLEVLWSQALAMPASMYAEAGMLRWRPVIMQLAQAQMSLSLAVVAFALALLAALVLLVRVAVYQSVLAALLPGTAA